MTRSGGAVFGHGLASPLITAPAFGASPLNTPGPNHLETRQMTVIMDRLLRIRRLATMRGDRAALLIVEARIRSIITESEMRAMWGDR